MPRPRTARDYQDDVTAASRVGLAEVMTILGAYREALVLIEGWAPYLILETFGEPRGYGRGAFGSGAFGGDFTHVGSIDIDFVVDPAIVDADQYATIVERLRQHGYEPVENSAFQFQKMLRAPATGGEHLIRVDFLTPRPPPGQGHGRRHRQVQRDLRARTLEGAEVALAHCFWYEFDSRLPDGAQTRVRVKVADIVGSLALKGLAIGERYAEKDAYDIWALCAHHRGGPAGVVEARRAWRDEEPVRRGLAQIAEKFRARDAEGPTWVAMFVGSATADDHERLRTDAHMVVTEVLRLLD